MCWEGVVVLRFGVVVVIELSFLNFLFFSFFC